MSKNTTRETIEKLSASLNEISVKQIEWAVEQHKAYVEQNKESFTKKGRRCFKDEKLFSFLQYKGDWQIHRVFQSVIYVTNRQTRYELNEFEEVSQYFFNVSTFEGQSVGKRAVSVRPAIAGGVGGFDLYEYLIWFIIYLRSSLYIVDIL